tara:strand:+ start:379 stop:639 length:261 start_codon:yes stop_codon:yes gene_type:complete
MAHMVLVAAVVLVQLVQMQAEIAAAAVVMELQIIIEMGIQMGLLLVFTYSLVAAEERRITLVLLVLVVLVVAAMAVCTPMIMEMME